MLSALCLLASVLLAGLHAGFFFTWSFTVMNGLDAASPDVAIAAMQSVNANIRNVPFGIVFFGAPLAALVTTIIVFAFGSRSAGVLAGLGFLALAATVAVTAGVHVPWNDELAVQTVPATAEAAAQLWAGYSGPWTEWNHLRSLTSLLGCLFLVLAFRADRRN
ncbi:DUF1772 domain-containing protein [Minwuia sp.]|uniref:anthrone oxygenase family protein n=1 Tax=Minwuia sp. TaxID=2493630 RepID=UPI003A8F1A52